MQRIYASVNSSCVRPPSRVTAGHLCSISVPGGSGIRLPESYPWAFDTRGFRLQTQTWRILLGKPVVVTDWLVRQRLDKIVKVFKDMFP